MLESVGVTFFPPLKEFRPRNSKPKFSHTQNVQTKTMIHMVRFQKVSFCNHYIF